MAEIEHFCDPSDKTHPKFDNVRDVEVSLYSACNQMDGNPMVKTTIGKAVEDVREIMRNRSQLYVCHSCSFPDLPAGHNREPVPRILHGAHPAVLGEDWHRQAETAVPAAHVK